MPTGSSRTIADQYYQRLAESDFIGILVVGHDGRLVDANQGARKILGYSQTELRSGKMTWESITPSGYKDVDQKAFSVLQKTGSYAPYEKEFIKKDGHQVTVIVVLAEVKEEGRVVASLLDMTEHQKSEEVSSDYTRRLELAQQSAKAGTFEYHIASGKMTWTKELEALYGLPAGSFKGSYDDWLSIVHPDDRDRIEAAMRKSRKDGRTLDIEFRVIWPDLSVRWLGAKAHVFGQTKRKPERMIGINIDITDRKLTEEALRESEEQFRLLMEGLTDYAIYMLDPTGAITSWNAGAERIKGYTEVEVLGQHISIFYPPEEAKEEKWHHALTTTLQKGRFEDEGWRIRKDGSRFWGNLIITPLYDGAGHLKGFAKIVRDMTERRKSEEIIRYQAYHDALTGLPNRILLQDRLSQVLSQAKRDRSSLAVVFLDLDRFKNINDTLGHHVGDTLLKEVATRIQKALREEDTVARFGGDEFVIVLPDIKKSEDAEKVVKKIVTLFKPAFTLEKHDVHVSLSAGIAMYPGDGKNVQTLFRNADTALYHAKEVGRNTYQFYADSMNLKAERRMVMENSLRTALENNELSLYYQPIVDMVSGKWVAAEALLRWNHPKSGMIMPSDFISIAEETGIILSLGEWVIGKACDHIKKWVKEGREFPRIAINVSTRQFAQPFFIESIEHTLRQKGVDPRHFEFEMTESVAMYSVEDSIQKMNRLKELGFRLSIDDFGSGYSSLTYLKRLPIDNVKIDKSFIRYCVTDEMDAAIIQTISSMAHKLGLDVVAEGIESKEQLSLLQDMNCCDMGQGIYLQEAMPVTEFTKKLSRT